MLKLVEVVALPDFQVRVSYEDGVEGTVDLSHLAGRGVFRLWDDLDAFANVSIGDDGALHWSEDVELCPDALYLQISGKSPEQVFPNLARANANARD